MHACWYTVLVQRATDNSWVVTSTSEYDEEILLDWMQHAAQQTQVLHKLLN
jgi:3-deoxy-D-manno-octulosonic-acid transferase